MSWSLDTRPVFSINISIAALIASLASPADALPEFDRTDFPAGPQPIAIATGDFDADGDLDLAVVNAGAPLGVSILTNDGNAHFSVQSHYSVPAGMNDPSDVTAGDFDADGDIDLAVTIGYGGSTNYSVAQILTNNGSGAFTSTHFQTGYGPNCIVNGDLNGDGTLDLFTANYLSASFTSLFNDGNGVFSPLTHIAQPYARAVNCADIDSDGDLDFALSWLHGLIVGFNDGTGSYPTGVGYSFGVRPDAIAFADVDRDGDQDMAVADYTGGHVYLFGNNGAGTFTLIFSYLVQTGPADVLLVDLNDDVAPDMIMTSISTNQLEIRWNDGEAGFDQVQLIPVGTQPIEVKVADFDDDGHLDLVIANSGSNTVSVFTTAAACQADLNGDGVLNFFDVSAFLSAFAARDPAVDFTNDGVFDFFDVSAYLSMFSAGCP